MDPWIFFFEGKIVSTNSLQRSTARGARYDTKEYKEFKNEFSAMLLKKVKNHKPYEGEVNINMLFFFTNYERDVDNAIKPVQDQFRNIVFKDDKKVRKITAEKFRRSEIGTPEDRKKKQKDLKDIVVVTICPALDPKIEPQRILVGDEELLREEIPFLARKFMRLEEEDPGLSTDTTEEFPTMVLETSTQTDLSPKSQMCPKNSKDF